MRALDIEDYMRSDPLNKDRRRKAYTAVAAKMARVVYAVVTSGIDDRRFPEVSRALVMTRKEGSRSRWPFWATKASSFPAFAGASR